MKKASQKACSLRALRRVLHTLVSERYPKIREARATYNASHQQLPMGRSQLLPIVSFSARISRDTTGTDGSLPGDTPDTGFPRPPQLRQRLQL